MSIDDTLFPSFETLLLEKKGRSIQITLNRPEKLNAINKKMVEDLHGVMDLMEEKYSDSVLVFTGAGGKAFIAGADISELKERKGKEALQAINGRLMNRIVHFPFPTIAKIHGHCLGGGMELALACDLRIASIESKFGQPEVALGIIPGAGATFRLPALIGRGLAREMILTGLRIDAQRAYEIGLINHIVPMEDLDKTVEKIISAILSQGQEALQLAKRVMNLEEHPYQWEAVSLAQSHLFQSLEKEQRMADFIQKNQKSKKEN